MNTELDCECTDPDNCECEDEIAPVSIHGEVVIKNRVSTFPMAADHASYASFSFAGTVGEAPIRVLNHDDKRSRAVIAVSTGSIIIGRKEQLIGGQLAGWIQTVAMSALEIRNKQEVWIASNGSASVFQVLNERWQ